MNGTKHTVFFLFLLGLVYSGSLLAMQRAPRTQKAEVPGHWPTPPLEGLKALDADTVLKMVEDVLVVEAYPRVEVTRRMDEELGLAGHLQTQDLLHELLESFWDARGVLARTSPNGRYDIEDYARRFLAARKTKKPKAVATLVEEDETDSICCFYGSCCAGACLCSVGCVGCCLGWF